MITCTLRMLLGFAIPSTVLAITIILLASLPLSSLLLLPLSQDNSRSLFRAGDSLVLQLLQRAVGLALGDVVRQVSNMFKDCRTKCFAQENGVFLLLTLRSSTCWAATDAGAWEANKKKDDDDDDDEVVAKDRHRYIVTVAR